MDLESSKVASTIAEKSLQSAKVVDRSQEVAILRDGVAQPTLILSGISVLMKKNTLINSDAGLNINQDVLILINRELIPPINNASYSNCIFPREHGVRIIARKKQLPPPVFICVPSVGN